MTRRQTIVALLEWYQDVQPGLVDTHGGDGGALHTAGCWKEPQYVELERLVGELRAQNRELYWHLAEVYFRAGRKRVSACPKCDREAPPWRVGELCNHGKPHSRSTARLVPRVVRTYSSRVERKLVDQAIDWLEQNWRDDLAGLELPKDLRAA